MSKFNNSILVVYTPDWDEKHAITKVINQVSAILIDVKSGKKLKEEVIYSNSGPYTEVKVMNNPSNEFSYLLIRSTAYNGKKFMDPSKKDDLIASTIKMSALQLGNDLKVAKETEIRSVANEAAFLGSIVNAKGDLFIGSLSDGKIRMEKFNSSLALQQKLDGSIYYDKKANLNPVLVLDEYNDESVLVGMRFKNEEREAINQFWNFQFDIGKVSVSSAEQLTKEFAKSLKPVNDSKGKGIDSKNINSLRPVGIVTLKDKIIVLREARYWYVFGNGAPRNRNDALVISFYDKQWKLLKNLCIDKSYEVFNQTGRSLGYKLTNNKLYLISSALSGVMKYSNILSSLDVTQMSIESLGVLDKGNLSGEVSVEAGSTFWFNNALLINQILSKGTSLQKVEL